MRTTKEISDKLKWVEKEINRVSNFIEKSDSPNILKDRFVYSNGSACEHQSITFDFMLTKLVAQEEILKWTLNKI